MGTAAWPDAMTVWYMMYKYVCIEWGCLFDLNYPLCSAAQSIIFDILLIACNSRHYSKFNILSYAHADCAHSPFSVTIQVILFFSSMCILHIVTAHVPVPEPLRSSIGRYVSMVLGQIGSGGECFNAILVFAMKIDRNWSPFWPHDGFQKNLRDVTSAGTITI